MIKYLKHLRNKYVLTIVIFSIYMLFLDDVDIFTIARQEIKLNKLQDEKEELKEKYLKTKATLDQLDNMESLERYAREEKMFKKDDEDIFVIVTK
ncbi:MAG: septum formation initiator [Fluviicola sp.]|nr:MAG: septum formation initiator [Fluviicola sp.]